MQNSHHQLIYGLIAAYTILQCIVLAVFGYTPYPDSDGYILLAEQCVSEGDCYPIASKINEYPFLWNIGAINAVVASLTLFHTVMPLLVSYSLMKGLTAWLFYEVTKKICGSQTALIALILYVVYPANYGEGTSTLSELPFMCFCMLGIYLSLVRKQSFLGGVMLAIANWFRPMGLVILIGLVIFSLFKWHKSLKLVIGYIAMITIIGCATMHRTGLFLYQAKTGWMALADGCTNHAPESLAIRERDDWNVSQKDAAWQTLFIDWVKEHPKEYIRQIPQKLFNTYISDNVNMCTFIPDKRNSDYMYDEVSMGTVINAIPRLSAVQWLTLLNLLIYYAFLLTAFISCFYFRKSTHLLSLGVIIIGTLLLLFVGHGETRFHQPFIPFIIMLSAILLDKKVQI